MTGWTAHFREDAQCGDDYHREWMSGGGNYDARWSIKLTRIMP